MGKKAYLALVLAVALLLCACTGKPPNTIPTYTQPPAGTTAATTETPWEETEPTTRPLHSELYLPDYTIEQILVYFEEVALRMEYTDGLGDATLVQKWAAPIRYRIYGNPTQEDWAVLEDLFTQLNEIPGFPGIYAAADDEPENLTLSFLSPEAFTISFSEAINGEDAYGAAQFWYYTDTNEIHTANIGYRTDIDQTTRTSILVEEIVNVLGLSDTELRTDSITYQHSNENTALSEIDWLILKLLYDPAIQCGMDFDKCSPIIQQLYY